MSPGLNWFLFFIIQPDGKGGFVITRNYFRRVTQALTAERAEFGYNADSESLVVSSGRNCPLG